jgi:hypothetical protein
MAWLASRPVLARALSVLLGLAVAVTVTACDSSGRQHAATRSVVVAGPLAGDHWPAGSVHAGMLLHDDGRRLWAVGLTGEPRLLWKHRPLSVYEITAAPDGRSLAYSVAVPTASKKQQTSFFLYLLQSDGSITTVDSIKNFGSIESPIFLRAPTDPKGPVRLYWIRSHESLQPSTARLDKQVMVHVNAASRQVRVALRLTEAPEDIWGYAGSPLFATTVFRHDNLPTRLEVLRTDDSAPLSSTSLTYWTQFAPVANTDVFTGVAWLTPLDYAVPVGQRFSPSEYSIRLFRAGCEYYGSHVVYRGTSIDTGSSETPWTMLPYGNHTVLVLLAKDLAALGAHKSSYARWFALDVRTGRMAPTQARWTPTGWWTYVQPDRHSETGPVSSASGCRGLSWTYP